MKRIAILMTAFLFVFAVTTPAFADDTGKKSPDITKIAAENYGAVYLLDDLAPPILVACREANTTVSQEDYPADIVHTAAFISKHKQEVYIFVKSPSQTATTRGPAENTATINRAYDKATNRAVINQATQAKSKDATVSTSRPEDCDCDIVITVETSEEVIPTAHTDEAVTEVPNVVARE